MTIKAWFMDDDLVTDQRAPHRRATDADVSFEYLQELGILAWSGITSPEDATLQKIKADRGYTYNDVCTISPDKLPDYDNKIKMFYREHIHLDEEIRYCVEGSGYFDIRDKKDQWIRIYIEEGDLIIVPEGIYHRFTCDEKNYIKAMRLFVGEPVWTPYNRDEIDDSTHPSREKYRANFGN